MLQQVEVKLYVMHKHIVKSYEQILFTEIKSLDSSLGRDENFS